MFCGTVEYLLDKMHGIHTEARCRIEQSIDFWAGTVQTTTGCRGILQVESVIFSHTHSYITGQYCYI